MRSRTFALFPREIQALTTLSRDQSKSPTRARGLRAVVESGDLAPGTK
jgi:hypothetical protein